MVLPARAVHPHGTAGPARKDMNQEKYLLLRVAGWLDPIAIWSGRIAAWLIVPMVLGLTYEVVARYVFNAPTLWAYDMTFMLYGSFFMLGAAYTLQRKGHIRTDSLYANWTPRQQGWVDVGCYLVMFLPLVLVFLWTGWGYFYKSFSTGERFVSSPWMPLAWPFKAVMPLTGLLLAIQGISEMCKSLHAALTGEWADTSVPLQEDKVMT
ncbi:MAG: TRAP transporter small permease subunit [Hylemonella sp.]|jgi:TRAP-type mannitol/chloroaromatic compound transport system permease small subunit